MDSLDLSAWPEEHKSQLLCRLEAVLPQHDVLRYKTRVNKIDWNEIAFEDYSGSECRLMWNEIQKKVRGYRVLREVIEDAKQWMQKPWRDHYRRKETRRNPHLPRRPLSSYMIFYVKKKDKVLRDNPGLTVTELSKQIASMYRNLTDKKRMKYKKKAAKQSQAYNKKKQELSRLHPELFSSSKKRKRSASSVDVDDNIPIKPETPCQYFCKEKLKRIEYEENYNESLFIKDCREQWRNMSNKEKLVWINFSLDKEAEYHKALEKYTAENPNYVPVVKRSIVTKKERAIKDLMDGKPEKPPNSAYNLFSKFMFLSEDVKRLPLKERKVFIKQQWKQCTADEKKEYGHKLKKIVEQYEIQLSKYLKSCSKDEQKTENSTKKPKQKLRKMEKSKN